MQNEVSKAVPLCWETQLDLTGYIFRLSSRCDATVDSNIESMHAMMGLMQRQTNDMPWLK